MRSSLFFLSSLLSSISATLTASSGDSPYSIELRSVPGTQAPILEVAPKSRHVKLRRSDHALPKHLALRSVLGLDQDHIGRREEGESAPMVQLKGESYIADVTIGDQEIPVLIDTGSADLWVAPDSFVCLDENHNQTSKETCNIPVYFEGTFGDGVVEDQYFSIIYANGQYVYGEYGYDSVTFGGITVPKQQFALPSTGYFHASSGDFSGIMGLGLPAMTAAKKGAKPRETVNNQDEIASYDPWFTSADKQNLTEPVFSLAVDMDGGGVLALGGAADVPVKGDYVSTPILMLNLNGEERGGDEFTYYTIMPEEYIIAGQPFTNHTDETTATTTTATTAAPPPPEGGPAVPALEEAQQPQRRHANGVPTIIDSGLSTNILPPSLIKALYGAFAAPPKLVELSPGGPRLFAAPCDAEVPSFGIRIGGHVFEQPAGAVLLAGANATVDGTAFCALGSQPGIERAGALGAAFLGGVVAVFDVGAAEMRFAERDRRGLASDGTATGTTGTAGNGSTGRNSTGDVTIPPASSGLANTNAGGRLLPVWVQLLKQVACGLLLGQIEC
ncbi:hypothetical protein KVR01_004616 [Diaporthe batatas]|uniref:uncharacterized protein n=1 Tax=Diaporthe batatas TaxID=748121 RepID=UPI001D041B92|nr:uncharacterized protein KVR01_004616 [Diaporthe batatas]KAG8166064.1 hypothetical protein KVR01_004616 [Diaporthe batatas]